MSKSQLVMRVTDPRTGKSTVIPDNASNRKQHQIRNGKRAAEKRFIIEIGLDRRNLPPSPVVRKDNEIEMLKQQLFEAQSENALLRKGVSAGSTDAQNSQELTAADAIKFLKTLSNAEDINAFITGDERQTVQDEAARAIKKLEA